MGAEIPPGGFGLGVAVFGYGHLVAVVHGELVFLQALDAGQVYDEAAVGAVEAALGQFFAGFAERSYALGGAGGGMDVKLGAEHFYIYYIIGAEAVAAAVASI